MGGSMNRESAVQNSGRLNHDAAEKKFLLIGWTHRPAPRETSSRGSTTLPYDVPPRSVPNESSRFVNLFRGVVLFQHLACHGVQDTRQTMKKYSPAKKI